MTIKEPRDDPSPPRIKDSRRWPSDPEHVRGAAKCEDPASPHGKRLCAGLALAARPNPGVGNDEVGGDRGLVVRSPRLKAWELLKQGKSEQRYKHGQFDVAAWLSPGHSGRVSVGHPSLHSKGRSSGLLLTYAWSTLRETRKAAGALIFVFFRGT